MAEGRDKLFPPLRQVFSRYHRVGLKTLFYLFLIVGVLWTIFRTDGFTSPIIDPRLKINVDPLSLPASDSPQPFIVKVSGSTTLPSRVKVIANGIPYGETWTEKNKFNFEKVILRSSGIVIELQADAFEPWDNSLGLPLRTKSRAIETINEEWPTPTPTPTSTSSPTLTPTPMPAPTPSEPATNKRKVTAHISYRRMRLHLEVTLPNDDPRIVEFVNNRLTLPQFVERSLNMFKITDHPIQDKFLNGSYKTERTAVNTTVKAESNPKYDAPFQFPLKDGIKISPDWFPVVNAEDSFTLNLRDYTLENLNPPPTSWTNESATWIAKRNDINAEEGIRVKVRHNLLDDPVLFLSWFKQSPYELFWLWSYSYVAIILSLLVAFPVIWTLTLLRRVEEEEKAQDKQSATANSVQAFPSLRRYCRWLIALPLIAPLMYATLSLVNFFLIHDKLRTYRQALGYPTLEKLQKDDLRVLMASAVIIWLLALLLWLIFLAVRRWRAFYWPQIIFRGIHDAAAICLSLMILMAAVLSVLPPNIVGLHHFLATIIILLLVLLTLLQVWLLRRGHRQEMRLHPNRKVIALVALILLIAAAFLAYPDYPELPDSSISKIYNPVIRDLQTFLSLIRDMTPYLLLPVLVILLRQAKKPEPLNDFKLGQILFAGYLVGSAPNIMLIPFPFILAYLAYKRFVIEPTDQRSEIDVAKGIVFEGTKRQVLLDRVLEVPTPKYYQEFLTEFDRDNDGTLKISSYDRAKQQVKTHLDTQQVKLIEGCAASPEAKDYLLSVGIDRDNWKNGKWAFWRGFVLAMPFLIFYIWELAQRTIGPPQSYLLMRLAGPLLAFTAYWLVSAFFFGYFFAYIRGATGLKKGAYVSAVVVGCLFISWLVSLHSPLAILLRATQTFLFFTLLGAWADYTIFNQALGKKFNWSKFFQFEEVSSLTTLASAVLASLGVAITSLMTSNFTTIITQLVTMSTHQLPVQPPV